MLLSTWSSSTSWDAVKGSISSAYEAVLHELGVRYGKVFVDGSRRKPGAELEKLGQKVVDKAHLSKFHQGNGKKI